MWTSNTYSWPARHGGIRYYYYATVEELAQDIENNRTQVRIKAYAKGAYDPQYDGHTSTGYIYIDGTQVASNSAPSTLGTTYKQICTTTRYIYHNDDGTKSIQIGVRLSCDGGGDYLPVDSVAYLSPLCTLTKINRGLMKFKISGGWVNGIRTFVKTNDGWEPGQAYVKTDDGWELGV